MAYTPTTPPGDPKLLAHYVLQELVKIAQEFERARSRQLTELHAPPDKPRTGLVVFADGTDWNPGSGRGVYVYDEATSSWIKL